MIDSIETYIDHNIRPHYDQKEDVEVLFDIKSLYINETSQTMTLDLSLLETWVDPRIANLGMNTTLILDRLIHVWNPNPHFINGRVLPKKIPRISMRIQPDGRVRKNSRYLLECHCNMDWTYFPMDQQKCSVVIQGSTLEPENIHYYTNQKNLSIGRTLMIEFGVIHTSIKSIDNPYTTDPSTLLVLQFTLNRMPNYYIINYYLPSIMIVSFSWVSFWSCSVSNSVGCILFSFLSFIFVMFKTNKEALFNHYLRAIDIFSIVSLGLILLSFWDIFRKNVNKRRDILRRQMDCDKVWTKPETLKRFTLECRTVFPTFYIGFLIIYWGTLTINRSL
ncbi:gamma-aminobutyric acid receptor subunit beta isoform X2 [Lepeophtheirus salmonis]|nr:gamma-aminobutyric acid receptor subunit beta-1-like isoform X2 [Lepeophtheirus salmonis]